MNIVILYNKPNTDSLSSDKIASEEDTLVSAILAQKTLLTRYSSVTLFSVTPTSVKEIASIKADCIVNFVEYTGHELQYAANVFLELRKLRTPYTGCSFDTYYTTANKITMKTAFDAYSIPSPKWQLFQHGEEMVSAQLHYPLIVKLAYEHCGVGLTEKAVVSNKTELHLQIRSLLSRYKQPVIVEEYIDGLELQVTLIDDGDTVRVLPIAEYCFPKNQKVKILTYESRWAQTAKNPVQYYIQPASFSPQVTRRIQSICKKAYTDLGFRNYARFDLRLTGKTPYILETNANPGLDDDPENGLVLAYQAAGMTYADFLCHVINQAVTYSRVSSVYDP